MILLVDAGNSRIKWASLSGARMDGSGYVRQPAFGDYQGVFDAWHDLPEPRRVVIANVAGEACATALRDWVAENWRCKVEFVTASAQAHGVTNAYEEPARLGVDRWLALIAVRAAYEGPVCVFDCGSALTIDVMTANGQHLGGLIIPGLAMMRRALSQDIGAVRQSLQHEDEEEAPGKVSLLARDTRSAVTGGTLYTLIAVIDRIVRDVTEALSDEPICVIAGGDAEQLLPLLSARYHYEPDLVLKGLAVVASGSSSAESSTETPE